MMTNEAANNDDEVRLINANKLCKELNKTYKEYVAEGDGISAGMVGAFMKIIIDTTTADEQDKWIPVSERLPEEDGVYLVTLEIENSEFIDMAMFIYSEKDCCNNGFHKAYTVIAWQPLPEPYKKGGKEG